MFSGGDSAQYYLNKKKYNVPELVEWQQRRLRLRSAMIFVGQNLDQIGHYVSIVRIADSWIKFDDDSVQELSSRAAMGALRKNTYGYVYGLIYEQETN